MTYKVIDMLGDLPDAESMAKASASLATKAHDGYIEVYGKRISSLVSSIGGIKQDEVMKAFYKLEYTDLYKYLIEIFKKSELTIPTFVELLDEWNIEKMVIGNSHETKISGLSADNNQLADVINSYPDKFIGFAGFSPHDGMKAVRGLDECVRNLGFKGLMLRPFGQEMYANDRKLYPLYTKACELNIPIWLHTSINFSTTISLDYGRPIYIDHVASDFPELKIIMGHGGWPWVDEAIAICWKHKNVYMDFSSIVPKYLAMPGTGWEGLMQYGNSIIQDKIVFSSCWLMMGMPVKEIVEQVEQLPLKEQVKGKWLYSNAKKVLSLD